MDAPERRSRESARAAFLVPGLLLAAYGFLVLVDVLAHESRLMGAGLLLAGAGLVALARAGPRKPETRTPEAVGARPWIVAGLGAFAAGGILGYNLVRASSLGPPELVILAYGLLLLAASAHLHRHVAGARVETLVAWSFPLVAAPLGLYALDAVLDAGMGGSPLDAFIVHGLVTPMTWGLNILGFTAQATDQTVRLATPRGSLFLSVGVVCAGFQPGILFLGVFGLHAWQERTPPARLALLLGLGLLGVYGANLVRLLVLALVGYRWGGSALQTTHAHAGWILFVGWMLIYWWIVLRRFEGSGRAGTR